MCQICVTSLKKTYQLTVSNLHEFTPKPNSQLCQICVTSFMKISWWTMWNLRDVIHKTYRLTVWNDFSVELVHGHEGRGICVELDEAVGRLLTGELVSNELTEQE